MDLKVLKQDAPAGEQRMVWAEVYAPNRPDSDGEFMSIETIRKMCHDFAREGRFKQVDVQHNNQTIKGVEIVESFIARKDDPDFLPDSWVVGIHIPDDSTWQSVLKGDINGLSVEAMVGRTEQEVELDVPPVVSGYTTKSDHHSHQFYVTYGPDGALRGGVTDMTNGHSHIIKGGTKTEESNGHSHRYSAVDEIRMVHD